MHFKPANFSFMMVVATFLWTAQALSAQVAITDSPGPLVIDDFNTALDLSVGAQSGPGILGSRSAFIRTGNSITIGGGVAEFSASTSFDAGLAYGIGDGSGFDLTQGGANTHFSLSGAILSNPLSLNGELFWPKFELVIEALISVTVYLIELN